MRYLAELEERSHVPAETSRRMACDASVVHWHETAEGDPLHIGRKTRTIPLAIRRALKRRDGGCRFPGCSCSRFVDAHHIQHWADGGETSIPLWYGDRMDHQMAVQAVLQCEGKL